ncbi:MAG: hypothetical protein ACRDJW_00210 [Thermomicrobiales bacterium]
MAMRMYRRRRRIRRRRGPAVLGALLLFLVLAAAGFAADDGGHDHGTAAEGATPTAEEQAAADQFVADVTQAAARFEEFAVAKDEGYFRITPEIFAAHYVNPIYASDDVYLDPEKPEALVYLKTRDGERHLLGVMFLAPIGEGPTPGGSLTHWHAHEGMCVGPTGVGEQDAAGACSPGLFPIRTEMLHVWTFGHPDGPLAEELGRDGLIAAYRTFGR